ncbi:hypothetical protein [Flavobacterium piscis]|uniref:Uncharacterized protein n=1 Tax=Flavobacterium piscis TaxID=1114874 RepID=A0ABU1Y8X5_9FLAO|nr:hypothetical protein [Flavobacterium piscis]MDR7209926.1 hypothetical protein [Flavobacterium piscis]
MQALWHAGVQACKHLLICIGIFKNIKMLLWFFGKLCDFISGKLKKRSETCTIPIKLSFPKKTEKRKKEKESNLTGRDADRPKGIGISPEGWLVRNEQDIMPKSFCKTDIARHTFGFFFLFSLDKNINKKISCLNEFQKQN